MEIVLIAAVAQSGVIGREGALPWHLPDDLARFKQLTIGKPIVMGRKTFESIGRPLPKRTNLVLSRTAEEIEGCTVVRSVDEAIAAARAAGEPSELCVIGGEAVYAAFLPYADRLELTEVAADVEGDARFPDFDRAAWRVAREESRAPDARHALPFRFVSYVRR